MCSAVKPTYNNRETETERDRSGQGHAKEEGGHRGAGRCMYVHGNDECDVLWQMILMRIDMVQGRLG